MSKGNLKPPVTYQGSKQRIADKILDIINPPPERGFYDLCCGNGSISLALINQGFPPEKVCLVDIGPWGAFWKLVCGGNFDFDYFQSLCDGIPDDRDLIKEYMESLSKKEPTLNDIPYIYLLLQASSFGGKALWLKDNKWQNCSFRSYWKPTETSSRRYPVNPMMPMPDEIVARVKTILPIMRSAHARHMDAVCLTPKTPCTVYIDPPYANTTKYGFEFDVAHLATRLSQLGHRVYVSEGKALSNSAELISGHRAKGGISGDRKNGHEEWLSVFQE